MVMGIVGLLRVAWIAGIFPILIAFIPSSRLNRFHQVVAGFAQRTKLMQSLSHKFTVPQRFFRHFYVVGVLWTTPLIVVTCFYAYRMVPDVSEPVVYSSIASYLTGGSNIFSLYTSHSTTTAHRYTVWQSVSSNVNGSSSCEMPIRDDIRFKYSPTARMHICGYLTGFYFYTAAPLSLCCTFAPEVFKFATVWMEEFIVKGKNQMAVTEFDASGFTPAPLSCNPWAELAAGIIWNSLDQPTLILIPGSAPPVYLANIVANLALAAADTGGISVNLTITLATGQPLYRLFTNVYMVKYILY